MPFSFDPTVPRGRVRLLLADTDTVTPANQIFTDAEIDAFLALGEEDVLRAAALGAESIASSSARSAIAWKAMDRSVDRKSVPEHFRALAKSWRDEARTGAPSEEIQSAVLDYDDFGGRHAEFIGDE